MKLNPKYRAELTDNQKIKNYVLGGRGVVTLKSDTGVYHTYSFDVHDNKPEILWIYTLVDGSRWIYVGYYSKKFECFRLTPKSKYPVDSPIVKGIAYIFKMILNPEFHDDRMHLLHEGICCRCGRPLTNPASIELGIGPYCATQI